MTAEEVASPKEVQEFTCERCGYKYTKLKDYAPFLCHRCLRYIGKKVFTLMSQVQPPISRPESAEV